MERRRFLTMVAAAFGALTGGGLSRVLEAGATSQPVSLQPGDDANVACDPTTTTTGLPPTTTTLPATTTTTAPTTTTTSPPGQPSITVTGDQASGVTITGFIPLTNKSNVTLFWDGASRGSFGPSKTTGLYTTKIPAGDSKLSTGTHTAKIQAGTVTASTTVVLGPGGSTTTTTSSTTTTDTTTTTSSSTTTTTGSGSWEDGTPGAVPNGTTVTAAGVRCTYGGRRWVFINSLTDGNEYVRSGYTILRADLRGDDVALAASQQTLVACLDQIIPQWHLNSQGFVVGHSTNSTMFSKAIRGTGDGGVGGDPVAAASLVRRMRGIGLSGSAWRTTSSAAYPVGTPEGPAVWPSNIRRLWILNGATFNTFNNHNIRPSDNHMAMILPEIWHWLATMRGLISTPYSDILAMPQMVPEAGTFEHVDPNLATPWRLDARGNDYFIRMDVAAAPDNHTWTPVTMDGPAAFWETMES